MKKLSLFCLLLFSMGASASTNTHDFPEAYAGFNPQNYHSIDFNNEKSNTLSFSLAGKQIDLPIHTTTQKQQSSNNISFIQNFEGGSINATRGENSLFGQLHLDNKHYILTTNHAGIWAVELPQAGMQFNQCGVEHVEENSINQINLISKTQDKVAGTIIDILVIYDQAFRDRYPGNLLQTRIDQYLHVANQTFANSAIDLAVRQVGSEQVGYNFNDANVYALNALKQSFQLGIGSQGFENVPQLREQSGADLVIFFRTHNIETRGNCGVAYYPFSSDGVSLDPAYGVNIISDGVSSWSICGDQVVAHEIGHNLGAAHHNALEEDRVFPDGIGFAKIGQFGTVMGSFGTGDPNRFFELNYFSNPNVQCGGGPCGVVGQIDNSNVMNQVKPFVADYFPSTSNATIPPDFQVVLTDMDGDGVLDDTDEFPYDADETTDSDGDGVGNNKDAFPNDPRETSDLDLDGIGDFSDNDIDGDGVENLNDRFPYDATETADSDHDQVGNNQDEMPFEFTESKDTDGDGLGNNADLDDDNDGVTDIHTELEDLLVISVGNNQILRFDAQTGLSKGIEVLPSDGVLTFQSDLVLDKNLNRLYFTSASSIKSLDLMNPFAEPELIVSASGSPSEGAKLNTGFPTALATNSNVDNVADYGTDLYYAQLRGSDIRGFSVYDKFLSGYSFPLFYSFADEENIIDIEFNDNQYYFQGKKNSVYRSYPNSFAVEILGTGKYSWLTDPYALVATDDRLLHSDQGRNKIVITQASEATFGGIFADLAVLGYSNPTGMDITQDGRLLVAVSDQNAILQFDLDSGEFLGELVKDFGLDQPHKILLVPQLQDRFHEDADKVIRPNAGNWFNPATSGRGFNIGIFDNRLQLLWFTYDTDGNPIWYTAADFLNDHTFVADLLKTKQLPDESVLVETIGQITVEFVNEREAMMSWQIGSDSGQEPIYWLQFSLEPDIGPYTGMWTRNDAPGWGSAIINNGDRTIAIPFIYDDAGEPRWSISDVAVGQQPFNFAMNTVFSDTLCPTCSGNSEAQLEPSGTMTFNLSNSPYWSSDLSWPTPLTGVWNLEQTELVRISSEPTKPR